MDIVIVVGAVDSVEKSEKGEILRRYRCGSPAAPSSGVFGGTGYPFGFVDNLWKKSSEKERLVREKTFSQSMVRIKTTPHIWGAFEKRS